MVKIKLRDFYSFGPDCVVEVPDAVAAAMYDAERMERNYLRRLYWNQAHYSLDAGDGIEHDALFVSLSPCQLYERKLTMEQLYAAINALPGKQGRRIYAHYILGVPQVEIAQAEGISESAVNAAIERGLKNLEQYLKKYC